MDPDKDQAWFLSVTQALKNKQHFKSFFKLSFSLVLFFTSIWSLPPYTDAFTLAATAPPSPTLPTQLLEPFPTCSRRHAASILPFHYSEEGRWREGCWLKLKGERTWDSETTSGSSRLTLLISFQLFQLSYYCKGEKDGDVSSEHLTAF